MKWWSMYTSSTRSPSWKSTHSGKRSTMVSSMGGNVWDGKGCDDNGISTAMDAGSVDTG